MVKNYPPFRGHPMGGRGHICYSSLDLGDGEHPPDEPGYGTVACRKCGLLYQGTGTEDELFIPVPTHPGYTMLPRMVLGSRKGMQPVSAMGCFAVKKHLIRRITLLQHSPKPS